MKERKVVLTTEAIYDLFDIEEYIFLNFSEREEKVFKEKVDETVERLSRVGGVFGNTCLRYRDFVIFKYPLKPSIFLYVITDDEVTVLRVLREESDWESMITENTEYHI